MGFSPSNAVIAQVTMGSEKGCMVKKLRSSCHNPRSPSSVFRMIKKPIRKFLRRDNTSVCYSCYATRETNGIYDAVLRLQSAEWDRASPSAKQQRSGLEGF